MLVVKIELHSAITKKITTIGQMIICNTGESDDNSKGNYEVKVGRRNHVGELGTIYNSPLRNGKVLNYPRLSYNVWRLVMRALASAFPEEKIKLPDIDSIEYERIENAAQEKHF